MRTKEEFINYYYSMSDRLIENVIMMITNDREAAKDIIQNTALIIWEKHETFQDVVNINAFLSKMVRNQTIDYLRKNAKYSSDMALETLSDSIDDYKTIELKDTIISIMEKWPQEYRKAFVEFVIDGYTLKELAKKLNTTEAALQMRFKRLKNSIPKHKRNLYIISLIIIVGFGLENSSYM